LIALAFVEIGNFNCAVVKARIIIPFLER